MMGFEIDTCLTQEFSLKVTENVEADFQTWISKDMENCRQSLYHGDSRAWQRKLLGKEEKRTGI